MEEHLISTVLPQAEEEASTWAVTHCMWSILTDVSVSPMTPCVVVTATPCVGTVHQLVSCGGIAEPEVRNHPERGSVFGSRNPRNYVAFYFAVSKESRATTGSYCPALRRVYRHVWSIKLLSECWCEEVKKDFATSCRILLEIFSGDGRSSKHQIKAHYKHFVDEWLLCM